MLTVKPSNPHGEAWTPPPMALRPKPSFSLELVSISRLSADLELLLLDPDLASSDAEVSFDGGAALVGIHRCILAARSSFFRDHFKRYPVVEGKPRYEMSELLPYGRVGREAFVALMGFLYTGRLKPPPAEVSTCVDDSCSHESCRPVIDFAVELMYAASVFRIAELVEFLEMSKILVGDLIHLDKLIGLNYDIWQKKIKFYLSAEDLLNHFT